MNLTTRLAEKVSNNPDALDDFLGLNIFKHMSESKPKTIRELKEFLNQVPEKFLDNPFAIQQENELNHVHEFGPSEYDLFYDPNGESGSMTMDEWEKFDENYKERELKLGIPKGYPLFFQDF